MEIFRPPLRSLLADIDQRIRTSKRLKLRQLGYDGERLNAMYKALTGKRIPHKYTAAD